MRRAFAGALRVSAALLGVYVAGVAVISLRSLLIHPATAVVIGSTAFTAFRLLRFALR